MSNYILYFHDFFQIEMISERGVNLAISYYFWTCNNFMCTRTCPFPERKKLPWSSFRLWNSCSVWLVYCNDYHSIRIPGSTLIRKWSAWRLNKKEYSSLLRRILFFVHFFDRGI